MFYAYWECFQPSRTIIFRLNAPPPLKKTVYALLLIINPWAEIQHMPIDSQYNICFMPIENVSSHLGWIFFLFASAGTLFYVKIIKIDNFILKKVNDRRSRTQEDLILSVSPWNNAPIRGEISPCKSVQKKTLPF